MFNEIYDLLILIYKKCKRLYVSMNDEIKIENISKDVTEQIWHLTFVIVIRGVVKNNIIYFEKISERDSLKKLEHIKNDLIDILNEWSNCE